MLLQPLAKGYAAIATDARHDVTSSAKFVHDAAGQFTDFAYRANHVGAEFAKELLAAYYAAPDQRAYFHGC